MNDYRVSFFKDLLKQGYVRARVDGAIINLTDDLKLDRQIKHNIEIIIDRIVIEEKGRTRLAEAVESALKLGDGNLMLLVEQRTPIKREGTGISPLSPPGRGDGGEGRDLATLEPPSAKSEKRKTTARRPPSPPTPLPGGERGVVSRGVVT